jgi:hypothetical protein
MRFSEVKVLWESYFICLNGDMKWCGHNKYLKTGCDIKRSRTARSRRQANHAVMQECAGIKEITSSYNDDMNWFVIVRGTELPPPPEFQFWVKASRITTATYTNTLSCKLGSYIVIWRLKRCTSRFAGEFAVKCSFKNLEINCDACAYSQCGYHRFPNFLEESVAARIAIHNGLLSNGQLKHAGKL